MVCKICGNTKENNVFSIKEMMLGLGEKFEYFLCSSCSCLQINKIPENLEKYYPGNYYSYSKLSRKGGGLKSFLVGKRDLNTIERRKNILRAILNKIKPASNFMEILSQTNINRKSRILDVGTGTGSRILPLIQAGFYIEGIDPFLKNIEERRNGLRISRKDIYQTSGEWDLIMFNHSFEHLPDPEKVLLKVNNLLTQNGKCLIRTPVVPSYVWNIYKTDWVQIDAPRHFFIYSQKGMKLLAQSANFQIEKIIFDSIPFQFLGSELNKRGIAGIDGDFSLNRKNRLFSMPELTYFIKKTQELNKTNAGDQAAYILSKIH